MRRYLILVLPFLASLALTTTAAQAIVVDMNPGAAGQTSVPFGTDSSYYYGVDLVPSTRGSEASYLAAAGIPTVSSSAPCADPAAATEPDILTAGSWPLSAPVSPICWHSGGVVHKNETFTLTWEGPSPKTYWSTTKGFVQTYLSDVAAASGHLDNPYSDTTQYWDGSSLSTRASNTSLFGGGCDDNGTATCKFGGSSLTGTGNSLPNDCPVSPVSVANVGFNSGCVTDADIKNEVTAMVDLGNGGLFSHTEPGFTPVIVVLMPPTEEVCLDPAGTVCSVNSDSNPLNTPHASAQFCSYHSQVQDPVSHQEVAYVVQPFVPFTECDEPDIPPLPPAPTPDQLEGGPAGAGARLVSPLSQSEMAALVNPSLNGWFSLGGLEIDDQNGCQPLGGHHDLDKFTIGANSYYIQREFNNTSVVDSDPWTYGGCLPQDALVPTFVAPSAVNLGDTIDLDGSSSTSGLEIPNAEYQWNFGDGTTASGPSVVHTYTAGGSYAIKLTVTDRGGNQASLSQVIQVLSATGQPVINGSGNGAGGSTAKSPLRVRLQLLPQALRRVLSRGIALEVFSNAAANGYATVSISRRAARHAGIKVGRRSMVVIGTGTTSAIKDGSVTLHLRMSRAMVRKLRHLKHVTLSVRLAVIDAAGQKLAVDVAGNY